MLRAILFSFGVHLLALLLIVWLAPYFQISSPAHDTIEVELYPEGQILEALTPKHNRRTTVSQVVVPEKLRTKEDETLADFLSQKKQRVKEEMRAERTGKTVNRDNSPESNTQKSMSGGPQQPSSEEKDQGGYKSFDVQSDLQEMNRFGGGYSTSNDVSDSVRAGAFTVLNTDQNIYYSFYARMRDLVQYRFDRRYNEVLETINPGLFPPGESKWTTIVEFLLDKHGQVAKANIMKLSGIPAFDLVGIAAFKEARIFPNPPQELVEEDGFIHLRISFGYRVNSRWFASSR